MERSDEKKEKTPDGRSFPAPLVNNYFFSLYIYLPHRKNNV
jgi:hypothetical protein